MTINQRSFLDQNSSSQLSSAEEWSEFLVPWNEYKAEYNLGVARLIKQLFASCSEDLRSENYGRQSD